MKPERSTVNLIEQFRARGIETADMSQTCVMVLAGSPDRAVELMGQVGHSPEETLYVTTMPPGDPERREWAISVPDVYYSFVIEHVRDMLDDRGYVSRQEVVDMIERRTLGEAL